MDQAEVGKLILGRAPPCWVLQYPLQLELFGDYFRYFCLQPLMTFYLFCFSSLFCFIIVACYNSVQNLPIFFTPFFQRQFRLHLCLQKTSRVRQMSACSYSWSASEQPLMVRHSGAQRHVQHMHNDGTRVQRHVGHILYIQ